MFWIAVLLLVGCGDDDAPVRDGHRQRGRVDPPRELAYEVTVAGGETTLGALRERLPEGVIRTVVPRTPGALVERFAPVVSDVADRVPSDAPVIIAGLRIGEQTRLVGVTKVRLETNDELPLGAGVTLVAGGPHGSRFVGARQAPGTQTAVLLDDALVFADDEDALGVGIRWLADTRLRSPRIPEGVTLHLPPGASPQLRLMADGILERYARELRELARQERARHPEAPAFGEPEAVVDVVRERLARWVAYLPDVGAVNARLTAEGDSLMVVVDANVVAGSALARLLRGRGIEGLAGKLGTLPSDTALAMAWDLGSGVEPSADDAWAPALARVAGERMSAEESARLAEVERALNEARGRTRVVAIGGDGTRAWGMRVDEGGSGSGSWAPGLRDVFEVRWVGEVAGALLGCEGRAQGGRAELCTRDGVARTWTLGEGQPRIVLSRGAAPSESDAQLGAAPDSQRALDSLRDAHYLAAVVVPERVPAALSLVAPPLQAPGAAPAAPATAAPIAIGVGRRDAGLRVRVVASPRAVGSLLALLQPFFADEDAAP